MREPTSIPAAQLEKKLSEAYAIKGTPDKTVLLAIDIKRGGFKRRFSVSNGTAWFALSVCAFVVAGFIGATVGLIITRNQLASVDYQLAGAQVKFDSVTTELDDLTSSLSAFSQLLNETIVVQGQDRIGGGPSVGNFSQSQPIVSDLLSAYTVGSGSVGESLEGSSISSATELLDASYGQLEEIKSILESQRDLLTDVPNLWPLANNHGNVTLEFGPNRHPKSNLWYLHKGIDIAGSYGVPVLASARGKVIETGYDLSGGYGNYVLLRHKYGFRTRYSHLGTILVSKGEDVDQGQRLGTVGSTGISTGPHLDFQIILGTDVVDPSLFLKISRSEFARWKGNR